MSLRDLARRLGDHAQLLDRLSTPERSIRAGLRSGFAALSSAEQRLLCQLALTTGDDFPQWVAQQAADNPPVADTMLARLVEAGFVTALRRDSVDQARFRLHDLIRQFAREQAAELLTSQHCREALLRVAEGWHSLADHADKALHHSGQFTAALVTATAAAPTSAHLADPGLWFACEQLALLDMVHRTAESGLDRQCWALVWHCETYLVREARQVELIALLELAWSAASRSADQLGVACVALMLAFAHSELADFDTATRHVAHALAAAEIVDEPWLLAEVHAVRGQLLNRSGDASGARTAYAHSVELHLKVGEVVSAGEHLVLLSEIGLRMGDPDADRFLADGVALLRGSPARLPLARALRRWAAQHSADDQPAQARDLLTECLELVRQDPDATGELCIRTDLALVLIDSARPSRPGNICGRRSPWPIGPSARTTPPMRPWATASCSLTTTTLRRAQRWPKQLKGCTPSRPRVAGPC